MYMWAGAWNSRGLEYRLPSAEELVQAPLRRVPGFLSHALSQLKAVQRVLEEHFQPACHL